jgi:hypothetical protein
MIRAAPQIFLFMTFVSRGPDVVYFEAELFVSLLSFTSFFESRWTVTLPAVNSFGAANRFEQPELPSPL